jgi:hypothetical protein
LPSSPGWAVPKDALPGFAIVRIDDYDDPEDSVYVKRVVWSEELARSEVERLNRLNADAGCRYFWQYTRVDPLG